MYPARVNWKLCFLIKFLFILIHSYLARFKNNFREHLGVSARRAKFRTLNFIIWENFNFSFDRLIVCIQMNIIIYFLEISWINSILYLLIGIVIEDPDRVSIFHLSTTKVARRKLLGIIKSYILSSCEVRPTDYIFLASLLDIVTGLIGYFINQYVWSNCIAR